MHFLLFYPAVRAKAEKVKLLVDQLITCFSFYLLRKIKNHFITDIFNFAAGCANNMGMLINICIVSEFIFPDIKLLDQPKLFKYFKGFIHSGKAHCGILRLKLAV